MTPPEAAARFQAAATALGLPCPRALMAVIPRLAAIQTTPAFQRRFPTGRLVAATDDLRAARQAGLPGHLLPFLLDQQPGQVDYYCIEPSPDEGEPAVVVFAVHALVAQWATLEAFLTWLEA